MEEMRESGWRFEKFPDTWDWQDNFGAAESVLYFATIGFSCISCAVWAC